MLIPAVLGAGTHRIRCWYPPYQVLVPTVSGADTYRIRCRYLPLPRPISVGVRPPTSAGGYHSLLVRGRTPTLAADNYCILNRTRATVPELFPPPTSCLSRSALCVLRVLHGLTGILIHDSGSMVSFSL